MSKGPWRHHVKGTTTTAERRLQAQAKADAVKQQWNPARRIDAAVEADRRWRPGDELPIRIEMERRFAVYFANPRTHPSQVMP